MPKSDFSIFACSSASGGRRYPKKRFSHNAARSDFSASIKERIMDRSGETYSYFLQTGVSFDEIVLEGASGGVDSLIRYLQSRRQMFLRDSSQISLRNEDPAHYVRAIEVFDDALSLLERIKQMDVQAELERAASQMEEMAENGTLPEAPGSRAQPHV